MAAITQVRILVTAGFFFFFFFLGGGGGGRGGLFVCFTDFLLLLVLGFPLLYTVIIVCIGLQVQALLIAFI